MNNNPVPTSYSAWKHCIEVECGQQLDANYIHRRLHALENSADFHTQQFVRRWGEPHRLRVVAWFRQALGEPSRS